MAAKVTNIVVEAQGLRVMLQVDDGLLVNVLVPRGDKDLDSWTIGELAEAARKEAARRLPNAN